MKRPGSKKLATEKIQRQRLTALARAPRRITREELERSRAGKVLSARRTRRLVSLSFFVGFIALIAIVIGVTFSPLLAIKEIYVSGTERIAPERIAKALKPHLDTPLPLLDESALALSLSEFELIESFSATASPPNGLKVKIFERQAICIIKIASVNYLHDPAGVRIAVATDELLPEVLIEENPKNSLRFRNAMEVLLAMPQELLDQIEVIEARTKDDVRMVLRSSRNQRIIWGDSSDSVFKSKVLEALMKNNRRSQSVTFDVSSPNAPVVRFDDF